MQTQSWFKPIGTTKTAHTSFAFSLKCGAILLFFLFSVLVVACGSNTGNTNNNFGGPSVTATINLGGNNLSPTPTLPPYWCGAWATSTSPLLSSTVGVYAKFVQNVNGNPEGIGAATATATVIWPDGATTSQSVMTTSDGLAVFYVPTANQTDALDKITYVTVMFQKNGTPGCQVGMDRAAFFTLVTAPTKGTPGTGKGTPTATGAPGH
jgi:hypothetical protein